jgi:hypothetical protein
MWVSAVMLVFAGGMLLYLDREAAAGWIAGVLGIVFLAGHALNRLRVRALWKAHADGIATVRLSISEEGLVGRSGSTETRSAWDAIKDAHEGPHCFILYQTAVAFSVIPKRAFTTSADLEAFRELLGRKVTGRRWQ